MKKVLLLTCSPTKGGNGDTLIAEASRVLEKKAQVERIDERDLNIHVCQACYKCKETGVCVQKDDNAKVLKALHECDGLIVESPVYYNCMSAQALLILNRLCCTFACKTYKVGPKKKVGVFLTCTGSDAEEMKHHVQLIVDLPSIQRSILEEKTEVFTKCNEKDACRKNEEYLLKARNIADWILD